MAKQKREVITKSERIELKRKGTSDFLRVPAKWRHSFRKLQGKLTFDATYEEDENGVPYLIFKKVREELCPKQ